MITRAARQAIPAEAISRAISRAQQYLLSRQSPEGYWCGELEADSTLEADFILLMHFLGHTGSPKLTKAAQRIREMALPEGGWNIFPHGPAEVSATVKGYLALKLMGASPEEPVMQQARQAALQLGGVERTNTYSKFYLAMFGLYPWRDVPAIPPELMLFPNWFPFNLYEMSSWTRGIVVPLAIVWAKRPFVPLPVTMDELWHGRPARDGYHRPWAGRPCHLDGGRASPTLSWRRFFLLTDRLLKLEQASPVRPFHQRALRRAEQWMLERLEMSDGLGAIFPAMVNAIFALRCLGYPDDHPQMVRALRELEALEIEDENSLRLQPCRCAVWDTAIAALALRSSGLAGDHPALQKAGRWLLEKEVRHPGDWKVKRPDLGVGGWYFEFENEFYPDIDDTAMVLLALRGIELGDQKAGAVERALDWILGMQSRDGGWASFDADNTREFLTKLPFADHNAMIDPPTADITARVIEMLRRLGFASSHPAIQRGLKRLRASQEEDGSWYGRWGVNYIYGTWQAMRGLRAAGLQEDLPRIRRGAEWLRRVQRPDGGWGETCWTYHQPSARGSGPSTPSQTAWALMGLMSAEDCQSDSFRRGLDYLLTTQNREGGWDETGFTGTGFPKVFYLGYTLYRHYFPLLALGECLQAAKGGCGRES